MFAYSPRTENRAGEIYMEGQLASAEMLADAERQAAEMRANAMLQFGQNVGAGIQSLGGSIGGGISDLANMYSENKQLEAKASSYDDIGKILGTAMFSQNPDAMGALGNLQKEKDPRKKVMGYEQLFSLVGPMSNMMMAQGRMGIQQQGQQLATDRMYTQEQLRREREIMKQPPASNNSFTGGSKLRGLFQ